MWSQVPSRQAQHQSLSAMQSLHSFTSTDMLCFRPEPTPNWRTPRPLTPPPAPVQQGHPLSALPTAVELDSTVADTSSSAESVAERPDQVLNIDVHSEHENEPSRYRHFPSHFVQL